MESKADAERYNRYNEPDPEMEDGGDGTPHKPVYATMAPNVGLAKKSDGSLRFCLDFRQLNEITYKDSYPLPRISSCLDALGGHPCSPLWT